MRRSGRFALTPDEFVYKYGRHLSTKDVLIMKEDLSRILNTYQEKPVEPQGRDLTEQEHKAFLKAWHNQKNYGKHRSLYSDSLLCDQHSDQPSTDRRTRRKPINKE